MLNLIGGNRHRLHDAADAAFEIAGEPLLGRFAVLLGALLDLAALAVGARFRGHRGLCLGGLHRGGLEQLLELVRERDQNAGLDQQDHGMQHDAAEIGAAGIDRRRQQEVQRDMMQRDRNRRGDDRAVVAIGDRAGQRREEVHVHVDLPGMFPRTDT